MLSRRKLERRLRLLDELLDYAMRSQCRFAFCNGYEAPIRHMQTCTRCASMHKAIQMGLMKKVRNTYVKKTPRGDVVVSEGTYEHFSAIDGTMIL